MVVQPLTHRFQKRCGGSGVLKNMRTRCATAYAAQVHGQSHSSGARCLQTGGALVEDTMRHRSVNTRASVLDTEL